MSPVAQPITSRAVDAGSGVTAVRLKSSNSAVESPTVGPSVFSMSRVSLELLAVKSISPEESVSL